jgi:uncharacterized protein
MCFRGFFATLAPSIHTQIRGKLNGMNRLQHETSPYLLQHKDNPVDWYPWGQEALDTAQRQNKPILLSVGYSACHWCHVMAHESFEHEPTAQLMNEMYINIKVDREERPDIDDIYMQAVMALNNGGGGWPMTVFLLPDGRPFYGGTYYPREPRYGMPSFSQVLEAVHDAFINRYEQLAEQANNLTSALDRSALNLQVDDEGFNIRLLELGAKGLIANFDELNGGFGSAPKFPNPMNLAYLLRYYHHTQDKLALDVVKTTLHKMADGGIYDQIGGGFHRYTVDSIWLVPHFEKMLYDNAQLSRLYVHGFQVTGDTRLKIIAEDVYDYILREMTAPEGGFYSATDADSEGEEGKFFVWTIDELQTALAPLHDEDFDAVQVAIEYWGMSKGGNFEGSNILHVPTERHIVAKRLNISEDALMQAINTIKDRLYASRTQREHPLLDDKILTAWNGMTLASLAEGAKLLDRSDYLVAAERCGDFFLEHMLNSEGRLFRTYKNGIAKGNAYLEDYANLIDAFLELYQATYLTKWFQHAVKMANFVLAHFVAEDGAGFFDTSDDHEKLIVRPRSLQDNATPAGNTMMAKQLLRLFALTGDERYEAHARQTLRPLIPAMQQYPQAFGEALNATDLLVRGQKEVAIVGNPTHPDTKSLLEILRKHYHPNMITALTREPISDSIQNPIALLHHRPLKDGKSTVYVCQRFVCANPVNTSQDLEKLLRD